MNIQEGLTYYTTAIQTKDGNEVEVGGFFVSEHEANRWCDMIDALYEPSPVDFVGCSDSIDEESLMQWLDIIDGERKLDS